MNFQILPETKNFIKKGKNMIKFAEWEKKNFITSSNEPGLTVVFPSREIYFSVELLYLMRLENSTCPKTLDQWYELCHPSDHEKISKLENVIYNSHENFFSLTRKLYCGDGFYRNFRLDAFIQRDSNGMPVKLFGNEVLGLTAWLGEAEEGDRIEIYDELSKRAKILEAVRVAGAMTLNDITIKEDLERENLILRHEISRRIFAPFPAELKLPKDENFSNEIFNALNENLDAALNILPGNIYLKTLKRSLGSPYLNIAFTGLSGSGKSSLAGAFFPQRNFNFKDIPLFFREGEKESAKIFYQNGQVKEVDFDSKELINPDGATRIEFSIPGALIPEGVCIADTPGRDSFNGAVALKNILPELDFIIYVMPIRARLKGADINFIEELKNNGNEIIFALTKIDAESDDTEAGELIRTSRDKIQNDVDAIKNGMKEFFDVDAEVIPVSAKNALGNFFSRNSDEWRASNIDTLINFIKEFSNNPWERALRLRTKRALKFLENYHENSQWQLASIIKNLNVEDKKLSLPVISNVSSVIPDFAPVTEREERHLLSSLITSMREHGFKGRFFSLSAFNGKCKAMLLSADKNMSMKLLSRLSHNLRLEDLQFNLRDWLCTGDINYFECKKIDSHSLPDDEVILIAPPDYLIDEKFLSQHSRKLFNEYIPVVSVDLARLESGLSDLARSPYITELAFNKWVLAFPYAALLTDGQGMKHDGLKNKVIKFTEENGLLSPEFFIYENYTIYS